MSKRLLFPLILAAASLVPAAPALAATQAAASENWAGYVATPSGSGGFSAVSAGWTQPTVTCTDDESETYSSFWVGLGGGDENSDALEQIGTQGDCSADGTVSYYAWYELVPSAPVKLKMTIHAGDKVYARTAVSGDQVTLFIEDHTTGQKWSKTLTMSSTTPDTSTAEWVTEAPSTCVDGTSGECTPLTLADFDSATFTDAHATADGHTGSISDSHWTDTAIELMPSASSTLGGGYGGLGGYSGAGGYGDLGGYGNSNASITGESNSEGAAPGSLSDSGTSFTVTYGASLSLGSSGAGQTSTQGEGSGTTGSSGDGNGSTYGYGSGDGYGSTYGYGGGYGGGYGYGSGAGAFGYGGGGYGDGYGSTYGYGGDGYGSVYGYSGTAEGYLGSGSDEYSLSNSAGGYGQYY